MNTYYTPAMTTPETNLPTMELQFFSDADTQSTFVQDTGRGPEKLINTALALGAEAAALHGKSPDDIARALAASQLCIGLNLYRRRPSSGGTPAIAPGIYTVPMEDIDLQHADWHVLYTVRGNDLEISTANDNLMQASASFVRNQAGNYEPRELTYGQRFSNGPYTADAHTLGFREQPAYSKLVGVEDNKPARLRKRLHALTLLGNTATEICRRLKGKQSILRVAVEIAGESL